VWRFYSNPRGRYGEESQEGEEGQKGASQEVNETAPPKAGPDHFTGMSVLSLARFSSLMAKR
jgi:hypothetical protein